MFVVVAMFVTCRTRGPASSHVGVFTPLAQLLCVPQSGPTSLFVFVDITFLIVSVSGGVVNVG